MATDASMTLSPVSQGITVFPLPVAFLSIFQDVKQLITEGEESAPPCSRRGAERSRRTFLVQVKSIGVTVWHQVILQKN